MTDDAESKLSLYRQVWQVVSMIPKGQVATYGQIAKLIGKPRYARQVSYALFHRRRLAPQLSLPWYRVINAQGKIALNPTDWRFEEQTRCLVQENVPVLYGKVDLKLYQWQPDAKTLAKIKRYCDDSTKKPSKTS
ncbi:MAG: cysteine methyltransferase [Gammaproteobacteria bacterium CG11_big_fil_rev_8_21_14_0_20_46_22]|nr:MAG: cysteine methyltransferase [Gammaproteobacteria bacterium CG12_big_fil_rev_8_21_14_0_65_46_12]PIR11759.1 MAG: cysteine methyltransferase [Gammaproteobacteria bacterium CG11_big_fil_rev_8_21_14_0_20_46_22]